MTANHHVLDQLRAIVGPDALLTDPNELLAYECDGLPIAKAVPSAVVFPNTTEHVSQCVKILAHAGTPIVPRGSGTGLTGGSVAFAQGVIISTSRMTQIQSIDLANRVAVVQAGVRNQALNNALAQHATPLHATPGAVLRFSPDPSSQSASTIGGNAATNAGGINTLKYGVTTSHVLALEIVLPDGSIVTTGGTLHDNVGPDLAALICGSEGTLGIITRIWCRLTPAPRHFRTVYAEFQTMTHACRTVSDVVASGVLPTSMEIMDGRMISVIEQAFAYGFAPDVGALLLIELDGVEAVLDDQLKNVVHICNHNHARAVRHCADEKERAELWRVRKRAFGAIGRISRSYCTQDACVPRSKLPEATQAITDIGRRHGLKITHVFHAGDGNVHPILLFNEDDPDDVQRVLAASQDILEYCVSIGGTITGEHGVGVEKIHLMNKMFDPPTMAAFADVKAAFDPHARINDGKLIPSDRIRIQLKRPAAPNVPGGAL